MISRGMTVKIFAWMAWRRWAISVFIRISSFHCLADRVHLHDLNVVETNVTRILRDIAFLAWKSWMTLCIIILRGVFLSNALFIFKSCGLFLTVHGVCGLIIIIAAIGVPLRFDPLRVCRCIIMTVLLKR